MANDTKPVNPSAMGVSHLPGLVKTAVAVLDSIGNYAECRSRRFGLSRKIRSIYARRSRAACIQGVKITRLNSQSRALPKWSALQTLLISHADSIHKRWPLLSDVLRRGH